VFEITIRTSVVIEVVAANDGLSTCSPSHHSCPLPVQL
jgi:hypothetical protein